MSAALRIAISINYWDRTYERIVGQLEAFGAIAMRLQAKELEVALYAGLGDARLGGHRAHTPVRGAGGRLGVQRGLDQLSHALVVDRAGVARP